MYSDDEFLQLSALQHFVFCPRQCALIHIEQIWSENLFTAQGRIMHEKVHEEKSENRKDLRIERAISLRSCELGVNGKSDVVEFHKKDKGAWRPFPIEYKRGKPKQDDCDIIQLCAQALCLEEMLDIAVPCGAIFYGKTRRRLEVEFDNNLRQKTKDLAISLHKFIKDGKTPKPNYTKKCDSCSLLNFCMPKAMEKNISIEKYLQEGIRNEKIS